MNWLGCDIEVLLLPNKKCDGQEFFFAPSRPVGAVPCRVIIVVSVTDCFWKSPPWMSSLLTVPRRRAKAYRVSAQNFSCSAEGTRKKAAALVFLKHRVEVSPEKKKPVNTGSKLLHPRRRLIPRSNLRGKKEKVVCSASRVPSGSTLPRFFVAHLFATHRRTVSSSLEFCGCVRNKE